MDQDLGLEKLKLGDDEPPESDQDEPLFEATFSDVDYHGHLEIAYSIARQFEKYKRHNVNDLSPVQEENNRVSYMAHNFTFQRCR